jgi:hypothetical protein
MRNWRPVSAAMSPPGAPGWPYARRRALTIEVKLNLVPSRLVGFPAG